MKWESSCSICAWSLQGFLFRLFGRPTVVQRYRSIRASLQEVCIIDTKRTKCMMMRSCNTYCGHDFEGLWPQQLLYHFIQFDGHMSQGPLKHRNSMDVTEILGKCWNHLGSQKKSQKRPKNSEKNHTQPFHSVYIYIVKICESTIWVFLSSFCEQPKILFCSGQSNMANKSKISIYFMYCGTFTCYPSLLTGLVQLQ